MSLPSLHLLRLSPPCATGMHQEDEARERVMARAAKYAAKRDATRAKLSAMRNERPSDAADDQEARNVRSRLEAASEKRDFNAPPFGKVTSMNEDEYREYQNSLRGVPPGGDGDRAEPQASTAMVRPPSLPMARKTTVALLVLDFDGTMTTGTFDDEFGVPVRNVSSANLSMFKQMTVEQHIANFGGQEEIDGMRALFKRLVQPGGEIEVRILSYGFKEAILIALTAVGLDVWFTDSQVPGEPEPPIGSRVFGEDVPPLTDPESYKGSVISEWMEEQEFEADEVAYLDDQAENIWDEDLGPDDIDTGAASILADNHAVLHQGEKFSSSLQWIEWVCGLEPVE